jgi:hypothetical protein
MKIGLALLLLSSTAYADRAGVWSLGVTLDGRATGPDFSTTAEKEVNPVGGARLTLGFEDPATPMPPAGLFEGEAGLVPELFVGFLADDTRAEGYIGAGLRGELRIASNRRAANMRTAMYVAARGLVIGKDHDSATEFVLGTYVSRGADRQRFGWEGGAMIRPRPQAPADQATELDALFSIYLSWR